MPKKKKLDKEIIECTYNKVPLGSSCLNPKIKEAKMCLIECLYD